jgi:hypothetical protein
MMSAESSNVRILIRGINYHKEVRVVRICTKTMGNTYRHDWKGKSGNGWMSPYSSG